MRVAVVCAAVLAMAAALQPARANDSTAELATGGLLFVHNDDVEMRAEDLFISTDKVSVRYRFFNKSKSDVTVLVAFPLPEVRISGPDENIALPTDDPTNIFGFTTRVDGKPVKMQVDQHATAYGVDRTQYLRGLGIPLAPQLKATDEALDRLPRAKWNELLQQGLAEVEEYDSGKGMEQHLEPRWGLSTTFYWLQTFPPGKEIVIEHQYKPSVGSSAQTNLGAPYAAKQDWYADYLRKYCIDKSFLASIEQLRKANHSEDGPPYNEQRIDYILKTGANWSGPIKDFHLVVDKGAADNLVSFCGQGIKKISATQFAMTKGDFTPDGDLSILILSKIGKP